MQIGSEVRGKRVQWVKGSSELPRVGGQIRWERESPIGVGIDRFASKNETRGGNRTGCSKADTDSDTDTDPDGYSDFFYPLPILRRGNPRAGGLATRLVS